jgi:Zn-dependent protease
VFAERSHQLFRVFGIRVGASTSWFLILFLMIYWMSDYFQRVLPQETDTTAYGIAVAATMLFFVSLLLHELGHALMARRHGIETAGIDLWLFGGVAKLSRDSRSPKEEFQIAAAGPAVTALIVVVCFAAAAVGSRFDGVLDTARFQDDVASTPAIALIGWLAVVNLFLLVFNLIPAFPLDGGRIARAIAWRLTGDRNRGTRFSARLGQIFSWVLIGVGIAAALSGSIVDGLWLALLGWFLGSAASGAVAGTRFSERLDGVTAGDVMDEHPVAVPAGATALVAEDEYFLRYRWPWFAVTDELGRFRGVIHEEQVQVAIRGGQPALTVGELVGPGGGDRASAVARDTPVEQMLGLEAVRRLGAVMVVDADERLCGVVTAEQLGRAVSAAAGR